MNMVYFFFLHPYQLIIIISSFLEVPAKFKHYTGVVLCTLRAMIYTCSDRNPYKLINSDLLDRLFSSSRDKYHARGETLFFYSFYPILHYPFFLGLPNGLGWVNGLLEPKWFELWGEFMEKELENRILISIIFYISKM